MNNAKPILNVAAALLLSVAATSCFTGVESTPRISDAEVRRVVSPPQPEDSFLSDLTPGPLESWKPGKRFFVTDSRAALVLNNRSASAGPQAGEVLRFERARAASDVVSRAVTEIELSDSAGSRYIYRVPAELDSALKKVPEIPYTIPLEIVDSVRARMAGRRFYVMNPTWRDAGGNARRARKFVEVEILRVDPGTDAYPVVVTFADTAKVVGRLMMSVGPEAKRFRSFGALFSFSDPRQRYRDIEPRIWENIIKGRVEPGMTRDECRLALGAPVEVIHRTGYSYLHETWRYESGEYLIFEDGKLVR